MGKVLKRRDMHLFSRLGRNLAFDVNDLHLFEINTLTGAILRAADGKTPAQLTAALADRYDKDEVAGVVEQLMKLDLIGFQPPETDGPESSGADRPDTDATLTKMVLYVTQDCNLRCRYCLTRRGGNIKDKYMSGAVARAAVDLFLEKASRAEDLTISLYGGEPLLNFDLVKEVVGYAGGKVKASGQRINYSMTTNGTLLTDEVIDFACRHRFRILLSLDGDRRIHDANRVFPDGSGSFDKVMSGLCRLKKRLSHVEAAAVVRDLSPGLTRIASALVDLGVGIGDLAPAISIDGKFDFDDDNIGRYCREFEEMVRHFMESDALMQPYSPITFSAVFKSLEEKSRRDTACIGGIGKIAVDPDGHILPCDNFIGNPDFYIGHVSTGIDKERRQMFRPFRAANQSICRICWARYLCGGWCPYYSFARYGDLEKPLETLCEMNRNYFEVALAVYSYYKKKRNTGAPPRTTHREG